MSSAKGPTASTPQQAVFKGHPIEAARVRDWTAQHTDHPDAPLVASELFVAVLAAGADVVEVALAVDGGDLKITAAGSERLFLRHSHGAGWRIIDGLSRITGITPDEHTVWARLSAGADA